MGGFGVDCAEWIFKKCDYKIGYLSVGCADCELRGFVHLPGRSGEVVEYN